MLKTYANHIQSYEFLKQNENKYVWHLSKMYDGNKICYLCVNVWNYWIGTE
jgi:hypothetical protein